MEQWGAMAMANKGKKAREIVEHYFPKAELTQLYE
jgi:peptidoglycan hydrolase-like amidase